MTTVIISLPKSLKDWLSQEVRTRGYGNVSEYFRGLLQEAQAKQAEARLEALLLQGLEGGEDIPLTRKFWKELKAEASQSSVRERRLRVKKR